MATAAKMSYDMGGICVNMPDGPYDGFCFSTAHKVFEDFIPRLQERNVLNFEAAFKYPYHHSGSEASNPPALKDGGFIAGIEGLYFSSDFGVNAVKEIIREHLCPVNLREGACSSVAVSLNKQFATCANGEWTKKSQSFLLQLNGPSGCLRIDLQYTVFKFGDDGYPNCLYYIHAVSYVCDPL